MTDSAEASAVPRGSVNVSASEFERIMAALNSFGATMDTHGQALTVTHETLVRHDLLLQQLVQSAQRPAQDPQAAAPPTVPSTAPPPPPTLPQPTVPEPRLPAPQRYNGNPGGCRGFLTQCQLMFELQRATYPSDRSKIACIITLLTDKALAWATAIWQRQGPECSDVKLFTDNMLKVFDQTAVGQEAAKRLLRLEQGNSSVSDYAITFRTLAAESGWNQTALISVFLNGLSDSLKDCLATREVPEDLESLITQSIRLDNRLRERRREHTNLYSRVQPFPSMLDSSPLPDEPEPMQIGRTRLTQAERERRRRERCCIYCGKPGHFRLACPELLGKDQSRPAEGGL